MDVGRFFQYIASGSAYTLGVTLIALPSGLILGMVFAFLDVYAGKFATRFFNLYSTILRGIPPIVLLFILYFMMSGAINLTPFWAGSISLGIISSAYQLVIFRGAILSVGAEQMMAARAVGMSKTQAIRTVIFPQMIRIAIPAWSNEAAIVVKDSSLVYAIGVPEILRRAQLISASTQQPFLAYTTAALIYFALVFLTNRMLNRVEHKLAIPSNP